MRFLTAAFLFLSLSANAESGPRGPSAALGDVNLPLSERYGPLEPLYEACEVRSFLHDGSAYLHADLSNSSGLHLYGGGNMKSARLTGNRIIFENSGDKATTLSEFTLDPATKKVVRSHLRATLKDGTVLYQFTCGEYVGS